MTPHLFVTSVAGPVGALSRRTLESRAGRDAARAVITEHALDVRPGVAVEIHNTPAGLHRGRPFYTVDGRAGRQQLSIAHSAGLALAGLASRPGELVGVDLEVVEWRSAGFETVALSPVERLAVAPLCGEARWHAVTRRWVLKEALLKALGVGLRVPLARITVTGDDDVPRFLVHVHGLSDELQVALAPLRTHHVRAAVSPRGRQVMAWVVLSEEAGCRPS